MAAQQQRSRSNSPPGRQGGLFQVAAQPARPTPSKAGPARTVNGVKVVEITPCGTTGVAAGRVKLRLADGTTTYGCEDCEVTSHIPREVTIHRHEDHGAPLRVDKGPRNIANRRMRPERPAPKAVFSGATGAEHSVKNSGGVPEPAPADTDNGPGQDHADRSGSDAGAGEPGGQESGQESWEASGPQGDRGPADDVIASNGHHREPDTLAGSSGPGRGYPGRRRVSVSPAMEEMTIGEFVGLIQSAGSWDQVVAALRKELDEERADHRETKRQLRAMTNGVSTALGRIGMAVVVREED